MLDSLSGAGVKRVVKGYDYNSTSNPKFKSVIGKNVPCSMLFAICDALLPVHFAVKESLGL